MRYAKRIAVFAVGGLILLVGLSMIVLPGPALVVIPVGLTVLATQFGWARRLLCKMKDKGREMLSPFRRRSGTTPY